jgi:hypothetical protein
MNRLDIENERNDHLSEQLIEAQSLLHEAHQNERDEYLKNLIALLSNAIADKEVDID